MILGHPVPVSDDIPGVSSHHQGQYTQVYHTQMHRQTDALDKIINCIRGIFKLYLSNQGLYTYLYRRLIDIWTKIRAYGRLDKKQMDRQYVRQIS